jgi:hypothetical protein
MADGAEIGRALGLVSAAVLALTGMGWLALALDAHWRQVHGAGDAKASTRRALRVLGALSLLASLFFCLRTDRPSMAALVWVMLLAGAVLTVALILAWRPNGLRALWPVPGNQRHK